MSEQKSTKKMPWGWIGAGVAGIIILPKLLSKVSTSTNNSSNNSNSNPATYGGPTITGAPPVPATFNEAYYKQYIYPKLVQNNPEIQNANHQLTNAEATQYKQNYLEIAQWLVEMLPHGNDPGFYKTERDAMQYHWSHYGVPMKYSFDAFYPPKNDNWVKTPENANSSGGGFWSTALSIVGTIISILGVTPKLNDHEVELVLTGSAVIMPLLSFYEHREELKIDERKARLNSLISEYTQ